MHRPTIAPFAIAFATALALAGCSHETESTTMTTPSESADATNDLIGAVYAWRNRRVERLQQPDGWLSLVGLHWIDPGPHYVGSGADSGIRLNTGPAHLGLITLQDGRVMFQPDAASGATIDGKPVKGAVQLHADDEGEPTVLAFNDGSASLIVIGRDGRYALRVRDSLAKTRTGFTGIESFSVDPAWHIRARFEAHPPGETIDIASVINTIEAMPNPGAVVFEKDGKQHRIEAVDEGDGQLFLIFADRTSGHQTYGAGRFLYADPPATDGSVVLDFNRAYNPPCVFTPYATCPLPPPENRLDLAVTAGEKKYAGH